ISDARWRRVSELAKAVLGERTVIRKRLESRVRRVFAGLASAGTLDADLPGVQVAGVEDSAVHVFQQCQALPLLFRRARPLRAQSQLDDVGTEVLKDRDAALTPAHLILSALVGRCPAYLSDRDLRRELTGQLFEAIARQWL